LVHGSNDVSVPRKGSAVDSLANSSRSKKRGRDWANAAVRELLDHLVDAGEQARRNGETQRLRSFQVHHKLELRRLLDRKVSRLRTLQNLVNVNSRAFEVLAIVQTVGHQTASLRIASGSSITLPSWSITRTAGTPIPTYSPENYSMGWPPLALAARPHVKASLVLSNSKTGLPTNTRCELPTL